MARYLNFKAFRGGHIAFRGNDGVLYTNSSVIGDRIRPNVIISYSHTDFPEGYENIYLAANTIGIIVKDHIALIVGTIPSVFKPVAIEDLPVYLSNGWRFIAIRESLS